MSRSNLARVGLLLILLAATSFAAAQDGANTYIVVPGDTFDTIARRLDISLDAILQANELTRSSAIFPGDALIIPANAPPYGYVPPRSAGRSGAAAGRLYVVQLGDVLDLIAAYYNVDLACLLENNAALNPIRLRPGDVLLIPTTCPPYAGLSTAGRVRGYEIGRERLLRPPTTAAAQSDLTVLIPAGQG
jgi:LysM repeat protein